MEDREFAEAVHRAPKLFTGFSDTTINHLMFYQLGLQTYYGPAFICDLGEIACEMLPYTKAAFMTYFEGNETRMIRPGSVWYREREDFSAKAAGTEQIMNREEHNFELLCGSEKFQGKLLGGCMESLYDILTFKRYPDEREICEKYHIFPEKEEWKGKILFVETSEEKPTPALLRKELEAIKERGVFEVINGVIVGKPQDEQYYEAYKAVYKEVINGRYCIM